MNYRTATILDAQDQSNGAGTKVMDINIATPISRIIIRWQVTRVAMAMTTYAHKQITKIELVDGSDVLFGMDGGQSQALCIYDRKAPTMNDGAYVQGTAQQSFFGIDFGRYLFDPLLAFDPTKFRNPQLKITYNEKACDASGADNELEVIAECFDEKVISPIGFLMSKEHHSYLTGAENSYEYISLPNDYPIRRMLIQGFYEAKTAEHTISEARLDEDNNKRVVFDWELGTYWRNRMSIDPPVIDPFSGYACEGGYDNFLTPTNHWAVLLVIPFRDDNFAYNLVDAAGFASGKGGWFLLKTALAGGVPAVRGIAQGWVPNHCFNFPFGDPLDPDDWYDVTRVGHLRLRLRAGGGGETGTGHVVLQQLRRY